MTIADNIKKVYDDIANAAAVSGQNAEDISLVAATKMNSADRVREAIDAGIKICGENRVQELVEKNALSAYADAELHFIGHLQRNKVKNLVGVCDLIQSVDSMELIDLISKRALANNICQNILIEVNIGCESAKSGILYEQADEIVAYASETKGIHVCGLMTIPPVSAETSETLNYFDSMYNLFVDIGAKKYDNVNMRILSMGMSHDFAEAIKHGSNMVRVGTAIFGQRNY